MAFGNMSDDGMTPAPQIVPNKIRTGRVGPIKGGIGNSNKPTNVTGPVYPRPHPTNY